MATHIPVALNRCVELLSVSISKSNSPVAVDATLGLGGHSALLLSTFPNLKLIAIDRDPTAIEIAKERLAKFESRITYVNKTYDLIDEAIAQLNLPAVNAILFDLGVSSMQLDQAQRGFSYSQTAPLDMRMNPKDLKTAKTIVNSYSVAELTKIFKVYGEEKFANRIAKNIEKARGKSEIQDTAQLAQLIKDSIPAPARRIGGNPAKRSFQALRIEVNNELSILEQALPKALAALAVGGRMVVMSYQSLEDKLVKQIFKSVTQTNSPIRLPIELPGSASKFSLLTKSSEGASEAEISENPRAASMRLRAIERLAA